MPFQRQSYPYCVHGTYVGGCGVDLMCFACEMGDDLTDEELAEHKARKAEWDAEQESEEGRERAFWSLPAHVLDGP